MLSPSLLIVGSALLVVLLYHLIRDWWRGFFLGALLFFLTYWASFKGKL